MAAKPKIPVIVGPTASGKTGVGIALAQKFDGEIISCDSRQVYRGLDIGSAKPTAEEKRDAPHHLIDIVDPDETFTAGKFVDFAEAAISDILSRGKLPIIVGGTGLYLKALTDGLFDELAVPQSLRESLEEEAERVGTEQMHRRLAEVDPEAAAKIHTNDRMRTLRALEVYRATGRPISEHRRGQSKPDRYDFCIIGLRHDRELLYKRIEMRTDMMIEQGLVAEVDALLASGLDRNANALASIGYQEIVAYRDGKFTLEEAIEQIKKNTRRYAKRQLTWFRKTEGLQWAAPGDAVIEIVQRFLNN